MIFPELNNEGIFNKELDTTLFYMDMLERFVDEVLEKKDKGIVLTSYTREQFNRDINYYLDGLSNGLEDELVAEAFNKRKINGQIAKGKKSKNEKRELINDYYIFMMLYTGASMVQIAKVETADNNWTSLGYFEAFCRDTGYLFAANDREHELSAKHSSSAQIAHLNRPIQKAKTEILKEWKKERKAIIVSRGKAQFCRDMQNKHKDKEGNDLIKDVKTIQGWITDWERTLL